MKNFIIPGKKDTVLALISKKLIDITKHPDVAEENSFYRLGTEVPYIAETLESSFRFGSLDLDVPSYWIEKTIRTDPDTGSMNPIKAQSIADKLLVSLFATGRFPVGYYDLSGIRMGRHMYKLASCGHPTEILRPTFSLLSLNFPVWAKALPHLGKEISLVL